MEDDGRTGDWVFQHLEGERMKMIDINDSFHKALRRVQIEEVGLIREGVGVVKDMGLRRPLRRG